MYFDLPPGSRTRRRPPSPSSCSLPATATTATTATTTLLPFRRSGRTVNVAAALGSVQSYLQPQWAVQPTEPLWGASAMAGAAPRVASPPPPQVFQRDGAWTSHAPSTAATVAAIPSQPYYCVNNNNIDLSPCGQPYIRSPYREEHRNGYPSSSFPSPTQSPSAAFGAAPTVQMNDDIRRASAPGPVPPATEFLQSSSHPSSALPLQRFATPSPFASEAAQRDTVEKKRLDRAMGSANTLAHGGVTASAVTASSSSSPVKTASTSRPRSRGITEVRPGCTTSTERVRYRNNVTKKLIDLYDEVAELHECRENMNYQVTQAMRIDPRYTRERHGEVRLAYKPTLPQQAAINAVDAALEALHDACHELVAVYLTPEEKRYLGIDTHLFQTNTERKTTYQYAPARAKGKSERSQQPSQQPQNASVNTSRASSSSSSSPSSSLDRARDHHEHHLKSAGTQSTTVEAAHHEEKFTTQATSLPAPQQQQLPRTATPFQEERTSTTVRAASPPPPPAITANNNNVNVNHHVDDSSVQFNAMASHQYTMVTDASPVAAPPAASTRYNDPAPWSRSNNSSVNGVSGMLNSPSPPLPPPSSFNNKNDAVQQQQQSQPAAEPSSLHPNDAEQEDVVAVGSANSPERQYAPARSTSSLGGEAWPSDTASTIVRASSVAMAPSACSPTVAKMPVSLAGPIIAGTSGGSMTMRGPQCQPLVKKLMQPPSMVPGVGYGVVRSASPVSKWPPGIPPGAKLVKMPIGIQPLPQQHQQQQPGSTMTTSAAARPSSQLPGHPASRTNSVTNRTASTVLKAPTTRSEFKRFLIDSDSDSTVI